MDEQQIKKWIKNKIENNLAKGELHKSEVVLIATWMLMIERLTHVTSAIDNLYSQLADGTIKVQTMVG